ncbi:hypothetical protein EX30DRAFT_337062 [Ascodesmis nigricans]|uniref:Uncharacterized protein n=1 Tax=Ascodesmis nigricans TaxID=341454 RepID=A0A4S2N5J2_9PEZI|nr:hypothetical protein EX30DRAFT_337062 [Ascodesmis nigricans]
MVMVGGEGDMLWLVDTGMLPQWKVLSGRIEGAEKTDAAPNAPGTLPWNAWIVKRADGKDWLATMYEPSNGSAGWWFACRSSEDSNAAWVLMYGERVWRERSPLCSEAFGLEMVYV